MVSVCKLSVLWTDGHPSPVHCSKNEPILIKQFPTGYRCQILESFSSSLHHSYSPDSTWNGVIRALESNQTDVATTAVSVTAERLGIMDFTQSLEPDIDTLTVAKDESRPKVEDFFL